MSEEIFRFRVRLKEGNIGQPRSYQFCKEMLEVFPDANIYEFKDGKWNLIYHASGNPYWEWPADVE